MTNNIFDEWYKTSEAKALVKKLCLSYIGFAEKAKQQDYTVVTFPSSISATYTKPVWFTLGGNNQSVTMVDSWQDLYIKFLNAIIHRINGEAWVNLYNWPAIHERLFKHKKHGLRRPKKLANGVMVETNFSAKDIFNFIRQISDFLCISEEVRIAVKKSK